MLQSVRNKAHIDLSSNLQTLWRMREGWKAGASNRYIGYPSQTAAITCCRITLVLTLLELHRGTPCKLSLAVTVNTRRRRGPTQRRPAHSRQRKVQDAQLSQRDRAAGCVIVFTKSRRLELGDNILRTL